MPAVHELDRAVGLERYATDSPGTGGRLRVQPADFRVREVETVTPEPVTADPGDYPHLVVRATLRNWDTNDLARALADAVGMSRERVRWAGTKDRRAVTTQLFTLDRVDPDALPDLDGVELEVVGRLGRGLRFGDLAGNAFEVRVREVPHPERAAAVTDELAALAGDPGGGVIGVPNVFGHQRFGSRRPVTHVVGRRLLAGDPEGAVMAYVGNPSPYEPERTRAARRFVEETRDWGAAAERFPGGLRFERAICSALAGGASYKGALAELPENLRRLFVHAAQSEVFNRVVCRRLDRGLPLDRPVAGDVVCFVEERAGVTVPDPDRTQRVDADRVDVVTRHCERGRAVVTGPLVGTETELAGGEPGAVVREVLEEVGLAPADFDLPEPYGSTGTRRALLVRTAAEITRNDEDGDPEEGTAPTAGADTDSDTHTDADPSDGATLTAEFTLPKGSYATALFREYLKVDSRAL